MNARDKAYDGADYGIDLKSALVQTMSEEKTTHAVLQETVYGWLKGTTLYMFSPELRTMTYSNFANHIGCDANEFYYSEKDQARVYTWIAEDKPNARFSVFFKEKLEGEWNVYASGSVQVIMPDDFIDSLKPN
ncbi:MAG: hypothetical protein IKL36_05195 [Clostridia bacterium]|nr:hypothetical protein [Clostridia bacterium]